MVSQLPPYYTTRMNIQLVIAVALISAVVGAPNHKIRSFHKGRIYGGQAAAPGQFPSIVSINDPTQFCDGSIISKNWVVTAAHCIEVVTSTTTIVAGTNLANTGGSSHKVAKWFAHEKYDVDTLQNDIGLIQIEDEFEFDDVTQATEFIDPTTDSKCTVAGWGVTDTVDFPEQLQFLEVSILSSEDCTSYSFDFGNGQTCAYSGQEGKGACFGDSGGPLVCDGKLAGIASFIIDDCGAGNPDFYTKAIAFSDWINEKTQ